MDKYVVKITEDAYADMECIYDGILLLTQSKKIAMQQCDLVTKAIMSLHLVQHYRFVLRFIVIQISIQMLQRLLLLYYSYLVY